VLTPTGTHRLAHGDPTWMPPVLTAWDKHWPTRTCRAGSPAGSPKPGSRPHTLGTAAVTPATGPTPTAPGLIGFISAFYRPRRADRRRRHRMPTTGHAGRGLLLQPQPLPVRRPPHRTPIPVREVLSRCSALGSWSPGTAGTPGLVQRLRAALLARRPRAPRDVSSSGPAPPVAERPADAGAPRPAAVHPDELGGRVRCWVSVSSAYRVTWRWRSGPALAVSEHPIAACSARSPPSTKTPLTVRRSRMTTFTVFR